jgi:hypothetical protein
MKKLFALVLAVAMVLSMASIAMAAGNTKIGNNDKIAITETVLVSEHIFNGAVTVAKDPDSHDNAKDVCLEAVPYGKTLYIPLYDATGAQIKLADAVDGLKVSAKWDENGDFIKSVEIGKKEGAYYIIIKTTGSSMDDNDVEGTLTITGKAYEATNSKKKTSIDKTEVPVVITLEYDEYTGYAINGVYNSTLTSVIPEDPAKFVFDEKTSKDNSGTKDYYMQDEEFEFTCAKADDVTFTVDTTHQSDIILAMDCDSIDEVEDKYASANLDFYVFNGATFKKTGELFIPADEGTYLYEIVDNTAKEVDAEYDDYDEGFYLKTKTLGAYVVSDVKLATAAATETDATATTNPTTGAAL